MREGGRKKKEKEKERKEGHGMGWRWSDSGISQNVKEVLFLPVCLLLFA